LHTIAYPDVTFTVPTDFFSKLILGHGFESSPQLIRQVSAAPSFESRSIDLHARVSVSGTEWYSVARREAKDAVSKLRPGLNIVNGEGSVCTSISGSFADQKFSPFGYGEICWRDLKP
jgi:hypothetical protein